MLDAGFWMAEAASLIESETDKYLFVLDFGFRICFGFRDSDFGFYM